MARNRLTLLIFVLVLSFTQLFAVRCFWWTVSSGGGIDDTLRADTLRFKRGFTVGQTAIGSANHGYDLIANYGFWNDLFENIDLYYWNAGDAEANQYISINDEDYFCLHYFNLFPYKK